MTCCKTQCTSLAIIIGILTGVILGVLYALGFIATGIIFWAYLAVGVAEILLAPLYAEERANCIERGCFCRSITLLTIAAVGTILLAAIGLIILPVVSITAVAIILGLATFFVVTLLALLVCVALCRCDE
ncbi:MAG: hypothetical protein IKJ06_03255 [Clostridia bacterium]|nr:hypothetical protein [Clostridia bacterium]